MSLEMNQWVPLTPEQTTFFGWQTNAAAELVFSGPAHEAGIETLRAETYDFAPGDDVARKLLMWPDPYEFRASCAVVSNRDPATWESAFVRIHATPDGYASEGVVVLDAVDVAATKVSGLYGSQVLTHEEMGEDIAIGQAGLFFFCYAKAHIQELKPGCRKARSPW